MSSMKLQFVLEAVDKATEKLRAVNKSVDKLNEPAKKLRASFNALTEQSNLFGAGPLRRQIGVIGDRLKSMGESARGLFSVLAAGSALAGGAFLGVKRMADAVDGIADTAAQLGMTTQRFQELGYAAQLNGSNADEFAQSMLFLQRQIGAARGGSKEAAQWFSRIGIPLEKLKTMNADEVFQQMAETFQNVGDVGQNSGKKIEVMVALLGRSGARMVQLLNGGKEGLSQYAAEARRLGVVLDDQTIRAMQELNDSADRARLTVFGALANALKPIAPVLQKVMEGIVSWTAANRELIATRFQEFIDDLRANWPAFKTGLMGVLDTIKVLVGLANGAADAIGGWGVVLGMFATVKVLGAVASVAKLGVEIFGLFPKIAGAWRWFRVLMPVLGAVTKMYWGLTLAWLASPFGMIVAGIAAIAAGAALIYTHWEPIKKWFLDLWETITKVVGAAANVFSGKGDMSIGMDPMGNPVPSLTPGDAVEPASLAGGASRARVDGAIKIQIDSEGRAKVKELVSSTPGLALDVGYTGLALSGL